MSEMLYPQNWLNLVAGLGGMFFEWLGDSVPAKKVSKADDLTVINGVGPTFAKRLNEAGIISFAQLAQLSPADVKTATNLADWQGDPADWIEQAQALA